MEELIRRLDTQADEIQLQLVTIRDLRSKLLETADEINGWRLGEWWLRLQDQSGGSSFRRNARNRFS